MLLGILGPIVRDRIWLHIWTNLRLYVERGWIVDVRGKWKFGDVMLFRANSHKYLMVTLIQQL